jgi:hypothetical protein
MFRKRRTIVPQQLAATKPRSLIEASNVAPAANAYRSAIRTGKCRASVMTCALAVAISAILIANARAIDIKIVDDSDGKTATILLSGSMAVGDALRVRSFIGSVDPSKSIIVQLGFSGGFRTDAMSIGRFLNQTRIRTTIPAKVRCTSPCPLVLVGGRDPTTEKPSYIKYSSAVLGFTGVNPNFPEKDYTIADLDGAVANTQRDILQIADYLRDVGADMNMLKYYQSVLKQNETRFITNEQALDLGIAVMLEETGQVIEPRKSRR